jgi:predicted O-methyltransferase YrrM
MSEISTLVSLDHFRYVAAHTAPEDDFLRDLKREAKAAGIPTIWISPEQGSFMQILLKLIKAREVIEVGTLAGYSAIVMARALPEGGHVRTIEIDPRHADFAQSWATKSDVADRVMVYRGAGKDVLATLPSDSADAAFIDADKGGYSHYLRESLRIVRSGGLIMVDNAFAFGQLLDQDATDPEVITVRAFNDYMAQVQELHGIIVPIGDGLWVAVKR